MSNKPLQINWNTWYFQTKEQWDEFTKKELVEREPESFPMIATHAGYHWEENGKDTQYYGYFYLQDLLKVLYPKPEDNNGN